MNLIHGDCITEMQKLIDDGVKVDLVLTDPPYGTTACSWDTVIPFEPMWACLKELTYHTTPIVLFGSEPFSTKLRNSNLTGLSMIGYGRKMFMQVLVLLNINR